MARHLTLFIDESGEAGITSVRSNVSSGASPYMTLGGVLIDNSDAEHLRDHVADISQKVGKTLLHCSELKHSQKVFFARDASTLRMLCFGLISKKSTLGWYKDHISSDSKKYYNKCAIYLLERAGLFVKQKGLDPESLSIVFEEGNFEYQRLRNFVQTCQETPLHPNAKDLRHINAQRIVARKKIGRAAPLPRGPGRAFIIQMRGQE